MAKGLKNLKSTAPATDTPATPPVQQNAPAAQQAAKETTKRIPPRQKSPEKIAEEKALKDGITSLLTANKGGLTAKDLRKQLYSDVTADEEKSIERTIRATCRSMGCKKIPIPESRQVLYAL